MMNMADLFTTSPLPTASLLAFALRDHTGRWELGNCALLSVFFIAVVAGLAAATRLWKQWYSDWIAHNPHKLFATLCNAHKLDRNQQRLLLLLAQRHQLPHPGTLFLRPDLFDAPSLGPQFAAQLSQIQFLRRQLFGAASSPENTSRPTQTQA
jgi:hypothetical protein